MSNGRMKFINVDVGTMSAGLISLSLFLDIFHGTPIMFSYEKNSIYYSWMTYLFGFLVSLAWPCFVALSGYIAGSYTLD